MSAIDPKLKAYLDALVDELEQPAFIPDDPIAIPHGFDDPRDQEVIGLYVALLAWGRRATIMSKTAELCERMRYRPYAFVKGFDAEDAGRLAGFKHRTFQPEDAFWLTRCLSALLNEFGSIEQVFARYMGSGDPHVGPGIEGFATTLLHAVPSVPDRLAKHVARPSTGSACKRINMYLRWMVRPGPVDLGLWTHIGTGQLLLPLDVHSGRTARALGLLKRPVNDWRATLELSEVCRVMCPEDPARYDYAFFGSGASGRPLDSRFVATGNAAVTTLPRPR
ncbi:MAG TPA: TIGR02757 family protein [Rhodothermales bacterium]|nr:TIGR02757 family protein [Rhodothermales bacterium]